VKKWLNRAIPPVVKIGDAALPCHNINFANIQPRVNHVVNTLQTTPSKMTQHPGGMARTPGQ
jgi:hypothetical protein